MPTLQLKHEVFPCQRRNLLKRLRLRNLRLPMLVQSRFSSEPVTIRVVEADPLVEDEANDVADIESGFENAVEIPVIRIAGSWRNRIGFNVHMRTE